MAKESIVVIDSEPMVREVITAILEGIGYPGAGNRRVRGSAKDGALGAARPAHHKRFLERDNRP